jgi:hypothetical protein
VSTNLKKRQVTALAVSCFVAVACSKTDRETTAADDTKPARSAPAAQKGDTSGGMAGMDHSTMDMSSSPSAAPQPTGAASAGGMSGMDHSTMPMPPAAPGASPVQPRSTGAPAMQGMDHSTMNMPAPSSPRAPGSARSTGAAQAMDHSGMNMPAPTSRAAAPASSPMAGMDHSGMNMGAAGSPPPAGQPADPGSQKLQRLLATLMQDPIVRQRIQVDTALRNRWYDADVRRIVVGEN